MSSVSPAVHQVFTSADLNLQKQHGSEEESEIQLPDLLFSKCTFKSLIDGVRPTMTKKVYLVCELYSHQGFKSTSESQQVIVETTTRDVNQFHIPPYKRADISAWLCIHWFRKFNPPHPGTARKVGDVSRKQPAQNLGTSHRRIKNKPHLPENQRARLN